MLGECCILLSYVKRNATIGCRIPFKNLNATFTTAFQDHCRIKYCKYQYDMSSLTSYRNRLEHFLYHSLFLKYLYIPMFLDKLKVPRMKLQKKLQAHIQTQNTREK